MIKRAIIFSLFACIILFAIPTDPVIVPTGITAENQFDVRDTDLGAADIGITLQSNPYIVLELTSGDVPGRGDAWSQLLSSKGVANVPLRIDDVLLNPSMISGTPAILLDGSLGSYSGDLVPQALIDLLIREDTSLILTGRSAWLLHRYSGRGSPSLTAPAETILLDSPAYSGAVFLSQPESLTVGLPLTFENGLVLPIDESQTEMSRLVNLTLSADSSTIAALRHDSWPLDVFLFAPETPDLLTSTGAGLLVNVIAFCTAIRESSTASVLSGLQTKQGALLAGGMRYTHEPTISSTYFAVHTMEALLGGSLWENWVLTNAPMVQGILTSLLVDYGSETGFMTSVTDAVVDCRSTAQGLWLVSEMSLTASFAVSEIVAYLRTRQSPDGGFENYVTTTYHVTESLWASERLSSIDTDQLELWLRSLVIDGSKTSVPDFWGAIGSNPASTSPLNNYATEYLRSLFFLGKAHTDPSKLTSWILTRTSNGDGSFRNSVGLDEEVVTGTASALTSMQMLGTLSGLNRTSGLGWFTSNQLVSGGFGLKTAASDLVGKTRETSRVGTCLRALGETSGPLAAGAVVFVDSIMTDVAFEPMAPLSSLMWTSWLLEASRLVHASQSVDLDLARNYISYFAEPSTFTVYPFWENLTTMSSPEYGANQYRTKSIWIQYFGVSAARSLGIEPGSTVVSDILLYLSQSQYTTGHYRPTSLAGTAHMQHSAAAVETLYVLDELDTIPYRAALETAILSTYGTGSWSTTGWTIKPFADSQHAIDYLSTRAAIRLGIVTPVMAAEIAASVAARLQYSDLLALSWDVATLSLLQTSGFSAGLESVDTSLVLDALKSFHFNDGWFNATILWQPVYTMSVLKMVSILGLRCLLDDIPGSSFTASADPTAELGTVLGISISITSSSETHSVIVRAFDESLLFNDVGNSDTLQLPVPANREYLGPWGISLMISDWGSSRAFAALEIVLEGTLQSSVTLTAPVVKMGAFLNGTIQWTLSDGLDAGPARTTIRLGNPPTYRQWNYDTTSPFAFSVPTTDFDAGIYSLTVTVEVPYCVSLILSEEVVIAEPNPTYLSAPTSSDGAVGDELSIEWSLHYLENNTLIGSQAVSVVIRNDTDSIVFTDVLISSTSGNAFHWIPEGRGDFAFKLLFDGNGTLDGSQVEGSIRVCEETVLSWIDGGTLNQYSTVNLSILLETSQGEALSGQPVHILVQAPSSAIVIDSWYVTNSTGYATILFSLSQNGVYLLQAQYPDSGFLQGSSASDSLTSWSSSSLALGGIEYEVTIGGTFQLWAQLDDLVLNPVPGQPVLLRITVLPSTVLVEQVLTSDSGGYVFVEWTAGSAGPYRFEAVYSGTISRAAATEIIDFQVLIPVALTPSIVKSSEIGFQESILVTTVDHLGNPISGITISLIVRGPGGTILYTNQSSTTSGSVTFLWTPSQRGVNEITVLSARQAWYQESSSSVAVDVYETPAIDVEIPLNAVAPTSDTIGISILDHDSQPVQGVTIRVQITLNATMIVDGDFVTDGNGLVSITVNFDIPGLLQAETTLLPQGWFLEATASSNSVVSSATTLLIIIPGQPVEQGSTVGISCSLSDFSGAPLAASILQIEIAWSNGTLIRSVTRVTDSTGHCALAQTFNSVGDFVIRGSYSGYGLNSSATHAVAQRVFVTPLIDVVHEPSCISGEAMEFLVNLTDALGNDIVGRTVQLSIEQGGSIVFEAQFLSGAGPSTITWYPTQGGIATITLVHQGNMYYLTTSMDTAVSIMELVSGSIILSPSEIDLFDSAVLVYILDTAIPRSGVMIRFEVLGMDLVPVWTADCLTNASGMASVMYTATETHGVLHVNAGPIADELLIGGDVQEQLIVKTFCNITVSLRPTPPRVNTLTNITVHVVDDLGRTFDGPTVTVSLYNPYGEIVKLGLWTNSETAPIEDGLAVVDFSPTMAGLYTVVLSSSGSTTVHGFSSTTQHTVYSATQLVLIVSTYELEVGQILEVVAGLLDHNNMPLVGRNITLYLDGPGTSSLGPIVPATNSTGYVSWSVTIDDEGVWVLAASFSGLGVYLPASTDAAINVRYRTAISLSLETSGDVVAGETTVSFSILLADSGGTPLEGFTVHYEIHEENLGLVVQGSIIQTDTNVIILNLTIERMGIYAIIVSFSGTNHYHASNAGLQFLVLGTTNATSPISGRFDRSTENATRIVIEDEVSVPIPPAELDVTIELHGPDGLVDLSSRLVWNESWVDFYIYGLPTGDYVLGVTVLATDMRQGCSAQFGFAITSTTCLAVSEETLPGLISKPHSLNFLLTDSLNEVVDAADVWVSLYDPLGREIYGHPLSTRTLLQSSLMGTEVSWTPALVGQYRLVLVFEGDEFLNATSLEVNVRVLYESSIILAAPSQSEFGEMIPVSLTLHGALGGISGVTVTLTVLMEGEIEQELSLVTGSRGIVSTNLVGLLAGSHAIVVTFSGSATQASCIGNLNVVVVPVLVVALDSKGNLFVGHNCSVDVSVSILGLLSVWNGSLEAVLFDPTSSRVDTWNIEIGPYSLFVINFVPLAEGTYSLNVTITGLPIIAERVLPMAIAIVRETLTLQLDAQTTPMFGGLGILAIVGFVMRKKMKNVLESMPGEWRE